MPTRRDFLTATLRGSSLLALAPTVPGFLAQTARAATAEQDARVLVVIQLDGGNDGINTVVPFADEGYARHRQALRLPTDRLLKLNDAVGLQPALRDAMDLLDTERLAIVPGVGYPNPNRSHFTSMAIWHTARFDPTDHVGPGWLGRSLDPHADAGASSLFVGPGAPPIALHGRRALATALDRLDDLTIHLESDPRTIISSKQVNNDLLAFVRRSALDAYTSADRLAELTTADTTARYPSTALAGRLRTIAQVLKTGSDARVYYTLQPGYDTHAGQLPTHDRLLREFAGALKAFLDDLAASGLADRVVVLGFSEFGRRVAENGSAGTDHGTAGPVFLAGSAIEQGLLGSVPSLTDLEEGDLKLMIDFRQVYAALLDDWLGLSSESALGGSFESIPLISARFRASG